MKLAFQTFPTPTFKQMHGTFRD